MNWMANSWKKEVKDFENRNVDQLQLSGKYLKAESMIFNRGEDFRKMI